MTTIVVSRKHKSIAADSYNTDSSGMARLVNKIEKLNNGHYFLGSGHLKPLGLIKRWLDGGQDGEIPELDFVVEDPADRLLVVDAQVLPLRGGRVVRVVGDAGRGQVDPPVRVVGEVVPVDDREQPVRPDHS